MNFRTAILELAPPWLQGEFGQRLLYVFATPLDALMDLWDEAIAARMPGYGTPEALHYIGADRRIPRGYVESVESYAVRLRRWLDDYRAIGSPYARMAQLRGYLTPDKLRLLDVFQDCGEEAERLNTAVWRVLPADSDAFACVKTQPSNWDWDGGAQQFARVWPIIFAGTVFSRSHKLGDGYKLGDGQNLGSNATHEQVAAIRAIVNQWRAAHARCEWIMLCFDDNAFAPDGSGAGFPDGTWGHGSRNDSGTQVASRNTAAIYWPGPDRRA